MLSLYPALRPLLLPESLTGKESYEAYYGLWLNSTRCRLAQAWQGLMALQAQKDSGVFEALTRAALLTEDEAEVVSSRNTLRSAKSEALSELKKLMGKR